MNTSVVEGDSSKDEADANVVAARRVLTDSRWTVTDRTTRVLTIHAAAWGAGLAPDVARAVRWIEKKGERLLNSDAWLNKWLAKGPRASSDKRPATAEESWDEEWSWLVEVLEAEQITSNDPEASHRFEEVLELRRTHACPSIELQLYGRRRLRK